MSATVHLIDASPYLFRAHFSIPPTIHDTSGRLVSATYGFTSFLVKYVTDERPRHIAVAFDRHFNRSFRNEFYPPYKAQRAAAPPELEAQIDDCFEVAQAIGLPSFIDPRYEADDLIATIIHRLGKNSISYVIVSPDKDLTQLVTDSITLYDFAKSQRFDPAAVEGKFGVRPQQIPDFLGLAGDSVDNIPGVKGIGPKTAAQLLRRYGSLEGIYENLEEMRRSGIRGSGSTAAKLEEAAAIAALSKKLATVSREAPLKVKLADLEYSGPDDAKAAAVFARLGFSTLRRLRK